MTQFRRLGWKRGLPRFKTYWQAPHMATLPASVDLTPDCPPVFDQLNLGACTANAGAGLVEFMAKKNGHTPFTPARLAIYYWTRLAEGTVSDDAGATLHDTMTTLVNYGAAHESLDPYDVSKFTVPPSAAVTADAHKHRVLQALAVNQDDNTMKTCLAEGYPFIIGFTVYESFMTDAVAASGIMPMPQPGEAVLGGHAVMVVGYDDATSYWTVRNSWGTDWGQKGYFKIPFAFLSNSNYADDFWSMRHFNWVN